jgi:three-Cys-motif partner protein
MAKQSDPNPAHWEDYGPFQSVKHDLIRCYLNGWYPKLSWSGRVLYVDTHAGRGVFETGDPGSPVVALTTLLNHKYLPKLLADSEYNFLFIERDPANLALLNLEIERLKPFPPRVDVDTSEGDAFAKLSGILGDLQRANQRMAPAFMFVDPYGFKIPARLLADLMKAGRVELFVNIMWRELDMLVRQAPPLNSPHAQTLDEIFGSGDWRDEIVGRTPDVRLDQAVRLLARAIGARWWTSAVRMSTGGSTTRYALLHLSNSDHGRDLMKSCSWSIFPAGEFLVRKSDNPDQQVLFEPEPNLAPLRAWVIAQLRGGARRWQDLHAAIRAEIWLEKHVNETVRALKTEGVIDADPVPGRKFSAAANPLLRLK